MKKVFTRFAVVFTIFWLAVLVAVIIAAVVHQPVKRDSVLRITLNGALAEQETPRLAALVGESEAMTLRALVESIRGAASDARIKGLVLEVQRPELSVAALTEIEEAMAVFRQSGKWSAAYVETAGELSPGDGVLAVAASAAEVVLTPSGEVNLAGLKVIVPFLKGTLGKLKIEPFVAKRGQYKTAPDTFTEAGFTPAHERSLAALADDLAAVVMEQIAVRRKVKPEVVQEWMRTGPHAAPEALGLGIVDKLAYWDTVVTAAEAAAGRQDCFVSLSTYAGSRSLHTRGPKIALIVGTGNIHSGKSSMPFGSGPDMGSDTLVKAFRDAREAGVSGILFRVDSPGGSYTASDVIRHEVELCREKKIPIVVSMGGYAASGGYLVSLGADRVFANPGTITGSIGVFAATFATRRFWQDLLGVTFGIYETAPEAVNLGFLDPPAKQERSAVDRDVDRIYVDFVSKVAKARKKPVETIEPVAQGRVWSGKAALARGLVDGLGGMEAALAALKELASIPKDGDVTLLELPEPEGPLAFLRQLLSSGDDTPARIPGELRRTLALLAQLAAAPGDAALALPPGLSVRF